MKTGNSVPAADDRHHGARVRDDTQLRDIEELVAKLQLVTKQLSFTASAEPARCDVSGEAESETG
ncbi:MAG: hypothetical protein ACREFP_02705 [Acetobacteraceae bacterium]